MATACGLTIVKRFPYRTNAAEEWSNTYWLTGDPPASAAGWRTLFDQMVVLEKSCYTTSTQVIKGYGYADNTFTNPAAVWSVDLRVSPDTPVAGTISRTGGIFAPGDAAAWVRWLTPKLTSQGKKVYVRKYFHDIRMHGSNTDQIETASATPLAALGAALIGTNTTGRKIANRKEPNVACTAYSISSYLTTRTLKRRGKRNP